MRRARVAAERSAEGELLTACGGAGEEEVGEVDADDEEDESDGAPEDDERTAELAADVLLQLNGVRGVVLVRGWNLSAPVEFGKEFPGFGPGLGDGDAGVEAGDEGQRISLHADVVHELRGKEIDLCARGEDTAEIEGFGKHADYGDGRSVERDRLSNDGTVAAELALPERIGQHGDHGVACDGFLRGEGAAKCAARRRGRERSLLRRRCR